MIYKLYKKNDDNIVVLISPNSIGEWYFDSPVFQENIKISDWKNVYRYFDKFFELCVKNSIIINKINVSYKDFFGSSLSVEVLEKHYEDFLLNLSTNVYEGFTIECIGDCIINDDEKVNIELFGIEIMRNNFVSFSIYTKNLCYLPHNPITKNEQYQLWKNNAPKLASTLEEFSNSIPLKLMTENGSRWKRGGVFLLEHPFYLTNAVIIGKKNPEDLDEFYMPFDLLDSNDLIV